MYQKLPKHSIPLLQIYSKEITKNVYKNWGQIFMVIPVTTFKQSTIMSGQIKHVPQWNTMRSSKDAWKCIY